MAFSGVPIKLIISNLRDDMAVDITNGLGRTEHSGDRARPRSFEIRRRVNSPTKTLSKEQIKLMIKHARKVKPHAAANMLTDSTAFPIHTLDHNGKVAGVECESPQSLPCG